MLRALVFGSVLSAGFVLCVGCAQAGDLPEDVKYLAALEHNEAELVEAARRFELQQFGLLKWDQKLIEEYAHTGDADQVKAQQETMQRRSKLVRAMWVWVLDRYPKNARANNYYGEYLFDYAGDEAGGLQHWMTAVALDDKLGAAHNNLGIYNFHTGEYARGFEHLEKAVKLEPDNPDFLFNMAQMHLIHFDEIEKITKTSREKIYKRAMEMSAKAADLSPKDFDIVQDYAVNFFAAENFGVQADWKAAVAAWLRAEPLARNEDERFFSLLNEARARMKAGDAKGAVSPLESAIAIHNDSPVAQQLLAKAKEAL